ncbi:hypothetical protein LTR12_010269 [Friedmanniomyces endolithicus]|nr:hypothetical protein LTR12_010269 [Friedmanniomyces endolithicus]
MNSIASLIDRFNFQVPFGRWQLFEFCDLDIVPDLVKHCCQNTLTAQWTKRLPFIQRQSPAELAADAVLSAINSLNDVETEEWTVIDFCSGAGGPIPYIEALVNDSRKLEGKKPIPFRLSDLRARGLAHDSWQTARGEELTRFVQDPYPRDEHGQRVRAAEVPMYDAVALDDEIMLTVAALRARLILLLRAIAIKAVMCDGLSTVIMDHLNAEPATGSPVESRAYDQGRTHRDVALPQTPGYTQSRVVSARQGEGDQEYRIRGAGGDSGAPWWVPSPALPPARPAQQPSMTPRVRASPALRSGIPLPPSGPARHRQWEW